MGNVMVIPAKRQVGNTARQQDTKPKLRVAAYCRVSTDSDEQATSYEAQVEHYTEFIQKTLNGNLQAYMLMMVFHVPTLKTVTSLSHDEDGEAGTIDMIYYKVNQPICQKYAGLLEIHQTAQR